MNKWIIALTVMIPTLVEIIDTSIVNVSLDHIRGSLSAGIDESTWAITAYLVSNAIVIPMSGWLSRFFGRKKYMLASISLFTLSSFLCGSAWSLRSLIFFRVVQGIGGGGLQPVSQSILLETFPKRQHGMAMAIFGIGVMFGPIVGPLLGGWITDSWSWRWIFYVNIPIGLASIFLTSLVIKDPSYMQKMKMRIDYFGISLLAVGFGSLQFVLDKGQREDWFSSNLIIVFSIIAFIAIVLLIIQELFTDQPIVNLRLFKNMTFATGNVVMFFVFFNLFGSIILLPIYLQTLMGYTAFLAGLVLGPGGFASMFVMPIVGKLVQKTNPKWVLIFGILLGSFSSYLMSLFTLDSEFWTLVWPRVVLGAAMGCTFIPLTTMTLSDIPKEKMAQATSIYNFLRNIGGSVGVAVVTTTLSQRAQFHQSRLVDHLTPFNTSYMIAKTKIAQMLSFKGIYGLNPDGYIYGQLQRQSHMMAFNDVFVMLSVMMIGVLFLVFIMRRKPEEIKLPAEIK
ncbi:MAG: EmrB/QacA family drug resistance transporter [Candidatus Schekmanbacteria bacterium RBG_13_48_7]|uniref:EmrB/QacA family drug resistance transporter n=1 Tax=Candidatus Schekmanbacteria bacterium RBG_13_48_7 TaxID=1817878 RepID=A0A1F7S2L8_9BACT|nr:MAG: EmrB/QacA family drug resistance transporter [Candidatus Schekmanbacteria bacterium RBG_13_48_7]